MKGYTYRVLGIQTGGNYGNKGVVYTVIVLGPLKHVKATKVYENYRQDQISKQLCT